jgi:hypothetical protein
MSVKFWKYVNKLVRKSLDVNVCNVTTLAFFTWNFFATKFLCWSST